MKSPAGVSRARVPDKVSKLQVPSQIPNIGFLSRLVGHNKSQKAPFLESYSKHRCCWGYFFKHVIEEVL